MTRFTNGFAIDTDIYWRSSYRISPFNTSYNSTNREIIRAGKVDMSLLQSFLGKSFQFTQNGRSAIGKALNFFHLKPDDEILILTTTSNTYISSCVTNEIEKVCSWTRSMNNKVKLIFLNHEFGYCYEGVSDLQKYNLPIIEDMALSFSSQDNSGLAGKIGDFVIYSIPKHFPIPFGGILKSNKNIDLSISDENPTLSQYLKILLTHYLYSIQEIKKVRVENYDYLCEKFRDFGFFPYFNELGKNIPGVFLFKTKSMDLPSFKIFMQNNGIESSVFYGKEAFFLPLHQNLNKGDLDFFYYLTKDFLENGNQ